MSAPSQPMPPPRAADTREPLPPRSQPGYYPGFSTLGQKDHWDQATRQEVESRLVPNSVLQFFTPQEAKCLESVLDCILPQSDRDGQHRISLVMPIDARLAARRFDGYFYEGCPEDDVAHRLGIHAVEDIARILYQQSFWRLSVEGKEAILLSIKEGAPLGNAENWKGLPPKFYWTLLVQDAVSVYYGHPFGWDEIGFGGPAYPRGYMRTVAGKPEPWEKDESRYEWIAPAESRSDTFGSNEHLFPASYVRHRHKDGT